MAASDNVPILLKNRLHLAGASTDEYTPLAWQVISKDADVYGLTEALRLDCCF